MRFLTWLATAGLLASALAIGCNPEPTHGNAAPPAAGPNGTPTPPPVPPPPPPKQ